MKNRFKLDLQQFAGGRASVKINYDEHIFKITCQGVGTVSTSGQYLPLGMVTSSSVFEVMLDEGYIIDKITSDSSDNVNNNFKINDTSFTCSNPNGDFDCTWTITTKQSNIKEVSAIKYGGKDIRSINGKPLRALIYNNKEYVLKQGITDITSLSWPEIIEAANNHQISNKCIGQEKTITINLTSTIGSTSYTVVLIGVNHDDLVSGGKANTTWQLKDCCTREIMNIEDTNAGSRDKCLMRTQGMPTLLDLIQDDVKVAIKEVKKPNTKEYNDDTIVYSNDKLFLLSVSELYGKDTINFYEELMKLSGVADFPEYIHNEGIQYSYWKSLTNVIEPANKYLQEKYGTTDVSQIGLQLMQDEEFISILTTVFSVYRKGLHHNPTSYTTWWMRSVNFSSSNGFLCMSSEGMFYTDSATFPNGVSFAFCI